MNNMEQYIRFVNLETGNTFDGAAPYIFWLDGEQSINLIYSKPICFISNTKEDIDVELEENEIFSLIDPDQLLNSTAESICDFEYRNLNDPKSSIKINSFTSKGVPHHNYWVHMIYIIATSKHAGEYIVNLKIKGDDYKVGGDFYGEDEALYINLSNNGIEIPEMVQKAIYGVNIHEEKRDNITLNRKWKELLSNYWDVVANKGSYKSLYNSLNWFEYDDKVRLCEVWKNTDTNKYFTKSIQEELSKKYSETLNGFAKTTYMALYYALEQPKRRNGKIVLDSETNPHLEYVVSKWAIQDLALKLCLLGNFYATYFMPIHLDLIHSTIEDVVYTSPIEIRCGSAINRKDIICDFEELNCSIKNKIYRLDTIECYAGSETLFKSIDCDDCVGVQYEDPTQIIKQENQMEENVFKDIQFYSGIGAIVDFKAIIPKGKIIKKGTIVIKNPKHQIKTITDYQNLNNNSQSGAQDSGINFSILCRLEGSYNIKIQFDDEDGMIYTKNFDFEVVDAKNVTLNIYRVRNFIELGNHASVGQFNQMQDYIFSNNLEYKPELQTQFVSALQPGVPLRNSETGKIYKGVCLNHLLIFVFDESETEKQEQIIQTLKRKYYLQKKYYKEFNEATWELKKTYIIGVSKTYGYIPDEEGIKDIIKTYNVYRNDYIFVPEFHKLVPLAYDESNKGIDQYTISDEDTLCVIPSISANIGFDENTTDWEFVNASNPNMQPIRLKYVKEPFIANTEKMPLEPGFYNIIFRYRLTEEDKVNEIVLESAFVKK